MVSCSGERMVATRVDLRADLKFRWVVAKMAVVMQVQKLEQKMDLSWVG